MYVTPMSNISSIALLEKLRNVGWSSLEEKTLRLGSEEVLNLLRWALLSDKPLTNLCFPEKYVIDAAENLHPKEVIQSVTETAPEFMRVRLKLLLDKDNKLIQAEAGEELIDLLFSFLTLPLSSVIKFLNKNSGIGCIDNLYKSVESLSNDDMKSDECMDMLLSPKLAPFFGTSNQLLNVDEALPHEVLIPGCQTCYEGNKFKSVYFLRTDFSSRQEIHPKNYMSFKFDKCEHGLEYSVIRELNPKRSVGGTGVGGGYVKGHGRFILTDNLCISPFSIQAKQEPSEKKFSLVERELKFGETKTAHLLRAALTSHSALSNLFSYGQ